MANTSSPAVSANAPEHKLYWWTESELNQLAEKLTKAIRDWCVNWQASITLTVECNAKMASERNIEKRLAESWLAWENGNHKIWFSLLNTDEFYHLLFSDHASRSAKKTPMTGEISPQLIDIARRSFMNCLQTSLLVDAAAEFEETPDRAAFSRWSGVVWLELKISGRILNLLINRELAASLLRTEQPAATRKTAQPPLAQVIKLIEGYATSLTVKLKPVEIDLGTLASLQVGDVLSFTHGLNQPVLLKDDQDQIICEAYLGQDKGFKAIELKLNQS